MLLALLNQKDNLPRKCMAARTEGAFLGGDHNFVGAARLRRSTRPGTRRRRVKKARLLGLVHLLEARLRHVGFDGKR